MMDTFPAAPVPPSLPHPGSIVTPETWEAYQEEQRTFRQDETANAKREARHARLDARISKAVALGALVVGAAIVCRHTEHTRFLAYDSATGRVSPSMEMRSVAMLLPPAVDDYLLKQMVRMRESWDHDTVASYLAGASCFVRGDDYKALDAWYNHDPNAPNQRAARQRAIFHRDILSMSDPFVEAVQPNSVRHVSVNFTYQDIIGQVSRKPVNVTVHFNTWKDRKAVDDCDPAGQLVSHYSRLPDSHTPEPPS